jgi:hypothetical protein
MKTAPAVAAAPSKNSRRFFMMTLQGDCEPGL